MSGATFCILLPLHGGYFANSDAKHGIRLGKATMKGLQGMGESRSDQYWEKQTANIFGGKQHGFKKRDRRVDGNSEAAD